MIEPTTAHIVTDLSGDGYFAEIRTELFGDDPPTHTLQILTNGRHSTGNWDPLVEFDLDQTDRTDPDALRGMAAVLTDAAERIECSRREITDGERGYRPRPVTRELER